MMTTRSCKGLPRREGLPDWRWLRYQIALTVEHNDRAIAVRHGLEVVRDQVLQRLCLAMARTGNNVVVLKARLGRDL